MSKTNLFYFLLLCCSVIASPFPIEQYKIFLSSDPIIRKFQEYVQIDTSKEENLEYAVAFWKKQAAELNLPMAVYTPASKPICVITVEGANPSLPSIMLNSHMDVVTVDATEWTYQPFSGYIDQSGNIFGRGTQDTKDVSIQYIEAIKKLKENNVTLERTIHVTLMPDEETGGFEGIKPFVDTNDFKKLNVGFALDEGLTSIDDTLYATYIDRRPWQMQFTVYGEGGHASAMPEDSAMGKAQNLINAVMRYREQQREILLAKSSTDFGAYTSININIMKGGLGTNIVPNQFKLTVDMRLATDASVKEMEQLVQSWTDEAGNGTELSFIRRDDVSGSTKMDESDPYWIAMKNSINSMGMKIEPVVCPATSDMLVLRNKGIPAIGFAPKIFLENRIHSNDEYQNVRTFHKGIDIYYEVIKSLANVPEK